MKKVLGFCALLLLAAAAVATPPNTPTLDGRPIEYDSTDLRGTFAGAPSWGNDGTMTNLFVTWDATYLYVSLQAWQYATNKFAVLLDVDPGAGTGATATTNWTGTGDDESYLAYNDYGWVDAGGFGLDYMLASEGTVNNAIRINYDGVEDPSTNNTESLYDSYKSGNNSNPAGTPIDMACLKDTTACPHKGFEARIPWSNLYVGARFGTVETNETVPRGATLRLLAGIHNNKPNEIYSSPDTIPNQTVVNHTNGILTTADYLEVVVDVDVDGIPDMLAGDVNGPYIRAATGAVGGSYVSVGFNEPVTAATVQNVANWSVGGAVPATAVAQSSQVVLLGLAAPIASGDLLPIVAIGVEDADANSRRTEYCLAPAADGIPQAVSVTFIVNTNSGMGIAPKASAFFVNGDTLPLEKGTPPLATVPLAAIPGSNNWVSATVLFPAGSPGLLRYKYSGRVNGTNSYEAIRLADYANADRQLTLNSNGTAMTVVDYLGAFAPPPLPPGVTNAPPPHNLLYQDPQRGAAGIRTNRQILFQLDLSMRRHDNLQRVMLLGSDPLRGFNRTGIDNPAANDYPGTVYLGWTDAGLQLFDDGSNGDATPDDGIFSRVWAFSTDGKNSTMEPGDPYSLVGGKAAVWFPEEIPGTMPYEGNGWTDRRSPRSIIFKYAVLTAASNAYESPSYNLEYYIPDPTNAEQIVLEPFVWDNDVLPPPPPSNAPTLTGVSLAGATATVQFENVPSEGAHGVRISTNLTGGFANYGHRAAGGVTNGGQRQWSATIAQASSNAEYYSPFAGTEPAQGPTHWEPSFIPATATVWRVYFNQFSSDLKGRRALAIKGNFDSWAQDVPMTFLGEGNWVADVALAEGAGGNLLEFKPHDGDAWLGGGNLRAARGGPSTWTPDQPAPDQLFTVSLDLAGTALAAATNVNVHLGYDPGWYEASARPMTNVAASAWEYAVVVPTNYSTSVNWVFNVQTNGSASVIWVHPEDVAGGTGTGSANWTAFMSTLFTR